MKRISIQMICLYFIACVLLLLCSCKHTPGNNSEVDPSELISSEFDDLHAGNAAPRELDIHYNYYNRRLCMDDNYLYYIDYYNILKTSRSTGETEKIMDLNEDIDINKGRALCLHGDYLYAAWNSKMYRMDKNGENQLQLDVSNVYSAKIIGDILFIVSESGAVYRLDIKNDSDSPIYLKNVKDIPQYNGKVYYLSNKRYQDIGFGLFEETLDETNDKRLLHTTEHSWMVASKHIAYHNVENGDQGLWRCDLDGNNPVQIVQDSVSMDMQNYSGEWIYESAVGNLGVFHRWNIFNGSIEEIPYLELSDGQLDILDGWIYALDKDYQAVRISDDLKDFQQVNSSSAGEYKRMRKGFLSASFFISI